MSQPDTDCDKDENETEGDESSEEEVEPKLKYVRMANDLKNILFSDSISCVAVHPKLLVVGANWGKIYLLDHQGNIVSNKALKKHSVAVNQISIDISGEFIASCSDDGKVFICGLCTSDSNQELSLGRLVKSVAIDPNYYKLGSYRRFVTGDERLVLHERIFLARINSTVIGEAEGGVQNIKWNGQFIAWASDHGVRVYDVSAHTSLGFIKWNKGSLSKDENYRCNLCWKDSNTLLVGWIDTVKICIIRKRKMNEMYSQDIPNYLVEPVSTFNTDFIISGIAPYGLRELVVLGYSKEVDDDGKPLRPHLHLLEPQADDYLDMYADNLSLRGYVEYAANDYKLENLSGENWFIIVSPKDIIIASSFDADERVEWLIDHCKFEEAMTAVEEAGRDLSRNSLLSVGRKYLDHLLFAQEYDQAAELCHRIFGQDKRLWQEDVYKFASVHQLRAVSRYLPLKDKKLDPHIYEMVLYEYLKLDSEGFLDIVKEWSPDLYNVSAVVNAVLEHLLVNSNSNVLLEALAILYSYCGKYDKSLAMYLKLKHKGVFALIQKYNLYDAVVNMIEGLMMLDTDQAINLFIEKAKTPPESVIKALQDNPHYLFLYLDALEKRESKVSNKQYHGILVKLYAKFAREKLLPLLKRSDNYPIQEALNICKERSYYPELVYLLGRIGNSKEALHLMTQQLENIEQAIVFCQEQDDPDLWNDLIQDSLPRPDFLTFLLQKIGTYIDPTILVKEIKNGDKIPGLKNSLVKMMHDYNLQVSIQDGCKKILDTDYFNLHQKFVAMQKKAICVDDYHVCGACRKNILMKDSTGSDNILSFYCHHLFHEKCLTAFSEIEKCIICHKSSSHVNVL